MLRSQQELPLRAMYESVAIQWQGSVSMSVAHVTNREHGDVPGSHRGTTGCPGAVQNWPPPLTAYGTLESLPHFSLAAALGRAGPALCPGNTMELILAGMWVSQP